MKPYKIFWRAGVMLVRGGRHREREAVLARYA